MPKVDISCFLFITALGTPKYKMKSRKEGN